MKIDKPKSENYSATVVEIKTIVPLANCDNLVAIPIFGFQAIVGKDAKIGDIGIFFPAETQLSEDFVSENSLYRHAELNNDKKKKGYFENNRRVKAVKFRGNVSNGFFIGLESLKWTGINTDLLSIGDTFDVLNGKQICKKYEVFQRTSRNTASQVKKAFKRVDAIFMPEHFDTTNYLRFSDAINDEQEIIVTQKVHGTSIRVGNTIVKRKLGLHEKIAEKLGVKVKTHDFDYIYGSRKVIKDANNPYQNHFYEVDLWSLEGQKLVGMLPENYIVYGELIGYTPDGKEIQKDYTYNIPRGRCELYIYRVSIVNGQGHIVDLSFDHVKEFCAKNNLKVVPEIWRGKKKDFVVQNYIDKRLFEEGHKQCLYLGENGGLVDEVVVIRIDSMIPMFYKAKGPLFFEHESKMLDMEALDLEATQS